MTISDAAYRRYVDRLTEIDRRVAADFTEYVEKNGGVEALEIQPAIDYAYYLVSKYGLAAATWAAEMYDAVAELSGASVDPAELADTATYDDVSKTVNGVLKRSSDLALLAGAVSRLAKLPGQDTMLNNAIRDQAYVAWIAFGDTCAFCLALSAEGWHRASNVDKKDGHAKHIHGNCDCSYAVKFDETSRYLGYNPDKYKRILFNANLDGEEATEKNRINALRRENYQKNREKILEQKRDAYERSKALEASSAEETDVD